jgi:hypothetical protein
MLLRQSDPTLKCIYRGCRLLEQIIDCIAVVSAPNFFDLYVS